jgi:hypothetical protein
VNLLGDNIDTIKKNTETLTVTSKKVDLEINVGKTKNMLLSRHRNASQSVLIHCYLVTNKGFLYLYLFIRT